MRLLRRLFKYLLWVLLLLVVVLGLALFTETGLRQTLELAQRLLPGEFGYRELQGSLSGDLRLAGLRYQGGGLDLQVERLRFAWQPGELFKRRLHVRMLQIEGTRLQLPESPPEPEPAAGPPTLPDIALPLDVAIDELRVDDTRITPAGAAEPIVLDELLLRAHTEQGRLQLETLAARAPQGRVSLSGALSPQGSYPLQLQLDWQTDLLPYGPLSGGGTLSGTVADALRIEQRIEGFAQAELEATARQALSAPTWDLRLQAQVDDLGRFTPTLADSPLQAEVTSRGGLDNFELHAALDSHVPQLGPVDARLAATGSTRALHIEQLALNAAEQPLGLTATADIDLDRQTLAAQGQWRELAWPPTGPAQYASPQGSFELDGTLQDYRARLNARLAGAQIGALQAALRATGSDQALQLTELRLAEPGSELALSATGQVGFADPGQPEFNLSADWQALRWPLTEAVQVTSPQGRLTAKGSLKAYQAELQATLGGPLLGALDARIRASGDDQRVRLEQLQVDEGDQGDLNLQASGEFGLADQAFTAEGRWQALRWPLTGEAEYRSPSGSFNADGKLDDYRFLLETIAEGANVPRGTWRLEGRGSTAALQQLDIRGLTLDGELDGTVSAAWQPDVNWQAELQGRTLNPGVQWPELAGQLGFTLRSQGEIAEGVPQATVVLEQLTGTLAQRSLAGDVRARLDGQDLAVESLKLRAGEAELQAAGTLAEQWNLDWRLAVPDLQGLVPDARGSVRGKGSITGARQQPRATLSLDLADVQLAGNEIGRLQGELAVDVSGATRSQIDLSGRGLVLGGQSWTTLRVSGSGTPADHSLQAELDGEPGRFELALAGALRDNTIWDGRLTRLAARDTLAGDWQLAQPAALRAGPEQASLAQACLASRPSRLCLAGDWQAGGSATGRLDLEQFTFERFRERLPEGMNIDTTLSGQASGGLDADGQPTGQADFRLGAGSVSLLSQGRPVEIDLGGGTLTARADGERAQGNLQLDLGELGTIDSQVELAGLGGQPSIDGRLQAALQNFAIVSRLVPQLQDIEGRIDADLKASGPLPNPDLTGQVQLGEGAVSLPDAGIRIEQLQLRARGNGDSLRFDGTAHSGKGQLTLGGDFRLGDQQLDLTVQGQDFQALDTFSQIVISPDINLTVTTDRVQLDGEVTVPVANISPPPNVSSRVTSSSDVVIVGKSQAADEAQPVTRQINARLRVNLGEEVWVQAAGFRGQLQGNLLINQEPQLAPRASGSVEVVAGNYTLYGQDLAIERGRLLFSGGPVDNPGLDLRVSRAFENGDVQVGAQVTGSLRQPQLNLTSTPSMPNSSIISYLVFGRAPGESSSENALLLQAATALGASGGNYLTKDLADKLDVELSFEGGSNPDESQLVIGKYLAPNLFVSYGIGLFDAVNTFSLRYDLTKNLSFETTTTGESNSVDLLYTIEH